MRFIALSRTAERAAALAVENIVPTPLPSTSSPLGCGIGEGLIAAAAEIDPVILEDARGPGQGCGNSSDRLAGESGNIGKVTH